MMKTSGIGLDLKEDGLGIGSLLKLTITKSGHLNQVLPSVIVLTQSKLDLDQLGERKNVPMRYGDISVKEVSNLF